ncbi:SAF domain-containing protein [Buchananella hordeovulneris]|uniref:SAF domain-containing protein n=1 Tax=Buchananella hordeovulneris TaxID=52770 RepID=UPI000F5E8C6E|nr:SAF domain-containing protein [Buchananella hordeovulneris]RRD44276.1 hypothetical protein EII13_04040 [Buchananella hordeovulneris]
MLSKLPRIVGLLFVALAAWWGWASLRPATTAIVVTTRPLSAGTLLTPADVSVRHTSGLVPAEAFTAPTQATGRRLRVDLPENTPLHDSLLTPTSALAPARAGDVLTPLPITDTALWELTQVGARLRVAVAPDPFSESATGQVVADDAVVVARFETPDTGLLAGEPRRTVVVSTTPNTATIISTHRGEGRLAVLLLGSD